MKLTTTPANKIINLIGIDEKITHQFAHSHKVYNANGEFLHFCALVFPYRYIVTQEQKEQAQKEYERMKAEKLANIKNKLVFVAMGMNYAPKYEGDPANHRIRTEIMNADGKRFFIEVGTGRGETMRIDFVVDRDQQKEFEEKRNEYAKKIEEAGGFWKITKGHHLFDKYEEYNKQPFYWYKKNDWQSLNVQYNKTNILKLVNSLFNCNFIEMEVENYFLTCEDYISISL